MSVRRNNHNFGFSTNVEVSPNANSNSNPIVNNNIVIGENEVLRSVTGEKSDKNNSENYPEINTAVINNLDNPYQTRSVDVSTFTPENAENKNNNKQNIESYLLECYTDILLSNNKLLLSNIISKNKIILRKNDLEKIIEIQIGKSCQILTIPQETSCISKISPFEQIDKIKILENDGKTTDYKNVYNVEYNDLLNNYCLCLKLCL